jgi:hypothetical protein
MRVILNNFSLHNYFNNLAFGISFPEIATPDKSELEMTRSRRTDKSGNYKNLEGRGLYTKLCGRL